MTTDVAVIGLGYVGLPLAQAACERGLKVTGFDVSQSVVDSLASGRSHVDDLPDDAIRTMLDQGFHPTTDEAALGEAATVVICVPTPLDVEGGPDLSAVRAAGAAIGRHLKPGMLVILESTTYPGTTEEILGPILAEASGLQPGTDFALAFSPERIDPGNKTYRFTNTPKVVGGMTEGCRDRAAAFYGQMVEQVVEARGTREAETAKLLENTYRHVNIALVNEMAQLCHELDVDLWDVIRCASSKPFGFQAFTPGPGVGGHCIPIDPNYLAHDVRRRLGRPFRFVELAQEINAGMPEYVAARADQLLAEHGGAIQGATVLMLGVTYKPDIVDQRESPAVPLAHALLDRGAQVRFHDPHVTRWDMVADRLGDAADRVPDLDAAVADADLVVIVQAHRSYDLDGLAAQARLVLDTRGVTRGRDTVEHL